MDVEALLKQMISVLETCPVTSDTDWVLKRNDAIVAAKDYLRNLEKCSKP